VPFAIARARTGNQVRELFELMAKEDPTPRELAGFESNSDIFPTPWETQRQTAQFRQRWARPQHPPDSQKPAAKAVAVRQLTVERNCLMSSSYFVLDYKGGAKGVPVFVDGLVQEYYEDSWNDSEPDAAKHYVDRTPLNLHAKHRLINFDYCDVQSLFIASDQLISCLQEANCEFVTRPLRVWESGGEVLRKKYSLLRAQNRLWGMDTERSEYRVNRDPKTGAIRYGYREPEQRTYTAVYKLFIDEPKAGNWDFFYCREARCHVVSERLASRLEGLLGVRLTPTHEYEFPLIEEKIIDKG
jgi:hypothetical protein